MYKIETSKSAKSKRLDSAEENMDLLPASSSSLSPPSDFSDIIKKYVSSNKDLEKIRHKELKVIIHAANQSGFQEQEGQCFLLL